MEKSQETDSQEVEQLWRIVVILLAVILTLQLQLLLLRMRKPVFLVMDLPKPVVLQRQEYPASPTAKEGE